MALTDKLTAIGDAIRNYIGSNELIPLAEMPSKVNEVYSAGTDFGFGMGKQEGYNEGYAEGNYLGFEDGKTEGKLLEYDAFWDIYQDNGNRKSYSYAFYGVSENSIIWNNNNFKPKYNMVIASSQYSSDCMFMYAAITDLKSILEKQGVVLDFSKTAKLNCTFDSSTITKIPPIDLSKCTSLVRTFYNTDIVTIELNNLREDCTFDRVFSYNSSLKNLTITGTIGQDGFNVQNATSLSKSSHINIINILSDTTTGLSITLSKTAVNKAFETSSGAKNGSTSEEWLNLIATKPNWAINLK